MWWPGASRGAVRAGGLERGRNRRGTAEEQEAETGALIKTLPLTIVGARPMEENSDARRMSQTR